MRPGRVIGVAAVLAAATGLVVRLWFLFHQPIGADEATVGLMARDVLHGHFSAFFWGQDYGGAEAYPVALSFLVFGSSALLVKGTAVVLYGVAAVLTVAVGRRLMLPKPAALAAGALTWAWPVAVVWDSTRELGFRDFTLCCGLGLLLVAVHVYDLVVTGRLSARTPLRRRAFFVLLGLLAGLGWWSSPEMAYFLVPVLLLLAAAVGRSPAAGSSLRGGEWLLSALGALVGALPWLWASVADHFRSIDLAQNSGGPASSYVSRLANFFTTELPLTLGLRLPVMVGWRRHDSPSWVLPGPWAAVLYAIVLLAVVAAAVLAWRSTGARKAFVVALAVFPFLYAASSFTAGGTDGRYGMYIVPLLALVGAVAAEEGRSRARHTATRTGRRLRAFALVVAACAVLTLVGFAEIGADAPSSVPAFAQGWGNPDAALGSMISTLRANGVRNVLADYWVAGDIAFVGGGKPSTVAFDLVRRGPTNRAALAAYASDGGAWLFDAPDASARAAQIFGTTVPGPAGMNEAGFVQALDRLGVASTTLRLGVLDAVVPERPVLPGAVGIPSWTYELPSNAIWTQWQAGHAAPASAQQKGSGIELPLLVAVLLLALLGYVVLSRRRAVPVPAPARVPVPEPRVARLAEAPAPVPAFATLAPIRPMRLGPAPLLVAAGSPAFPVELPLAVPAAMPAVLHLAVAESAALRPVRTVLPAVAVHVAMPVLANARAAVESPTARAASLPASIEHVAEPQFARVGAVVHARPASETVASRVAALHASAEAALSTPVAPAPVMSPVAPARPHRPAPRPDAVAAGSSMHPLRAAPVTDVPAIATPQVPGSEPAPAAAMEGPATRPLPAPSTVPTVPVFHERVAGRLLGQPDITEEPAPAVLLGAAAVSPDTGPVVASPPPERALVEATLRPPEALRLRGDAPRPAQMSTASAPERVFGEARPAHVAAAPGPSPAHALRQPSGPVRDLAALVPVAPARPGRAAVTLRPVAVAAELTASLVEKLSLAPLPAPPRRLPPPPPPPSALPPPPSSAVAQPGAAARPAPSPVSPGTPPPPPPARRLPPPPPPRRRPPPPPAGSALQP